MPSHFVEQSRANNCCQVCTYFVAFDAFPPLPESTPRTKPTCRGQCRRRAPHPYRGPGLDQFGVAQSDWPTVEEKDWCGDFEEGNGGRVTAARLCRARAQRGEHPGGP